jgi:Ca2+-binding EF-hand superfamily protein
MRPIRYGALALAAAALTATMATAGEDWKAHKQDLRTELFVEADVDRDGALSVTEFAAVPDIMRRRFTEKRLAEVDTNGDGAVSLEEFLAAPPPHHRRGGCHGPGPGDEG